MSNKEIRELMKKEKIYLWQVAEVLVIHETTLIKRFRTEMSDDHKNQVLTAIQVIKQWRTAEKDSEAEEIPKESCKTGARKE